MGSVYQWANSVSKYFSLAKVNESLAQENLQLKERLFYMEGQISAMRSSELNRPLDSLSALKYNLIPAKVIEAATQYRKNYLTLDKGENDGLKVGMGVISEKGVVGIVSSVSNHFSVILPIINDDSRTSVQIESKSHAGTLRWGKHDIRYAELEEVPLYIPIENGDLVKTSGYSSVFPEGIMVGEISEVRKKNDNFYDIDVSLSVDFNNLSFVNVISFIHSEEKDSLELKGGNLDDK